MPQPVDVGSVLGGRYKVTAYVLASADKDLVLDGVDQVLNRPVSILVASASNAGQVATSAREVATGEREGTIQVLDLAVTDGETYLVTERAAAADLLDLVIEQQDAPYIEPFFTDTLGSEIFGVSRSTEPEPYDEDDQDEEDRHAHRPRMSMLRMPRFGRGAAGAATASAAQDRPAPRDSAPDAADTSNASGATGANTADQEPAAPNPRKANMPPPPSSPPRIQALRDAESTDPEATKDSLNSENDDATTHDHRPASTGATASDTSSFSGSQRAASRFPAGAAGFAGLGTAAGLGAGAAADSAAAAESGAVAKSGTGSDANRATPGVGSGPGITGGSSMSAGSGIDDPADEDGTDYDDDRENNPRYTRLLVGVVLGLILVVGIVLATTQLLSRVENQPVADSSETTATQEEQPTESQDVPSPTESVPEEEPTEEPVEPVAESVSRLVPDLPNLNSDNDPDLSLIIDENPASYWGSLVFANETFGNLAQNMALVVELEEESSISEVEIEQLNGTGGDFTVLLNDEPSLEGATQIAHSGFTGPSTTIPVPTVDGEPATAQYVIVNFTQLPRLYNVEAEYPWGMRIAEINIS